MRIYAILRSENSSLVKALLDAGHQVVVPADPLFYTFRQKGMDVARPVEGEKYDALLVWSDAPEVEKEAVLRFRGEGVPTFEITHGSLNTYRQGHFECNSFVDTILAPGQEEVDFRTFYHQTVEVVKTGKPAYDPLVEGNHAALRAGARERLAFLPTKRPIIYYAMTWRHPFSTWEMDTDLGVGTVTTAVQALSSICNPFLIIKPHYVGTTPASCEKLKRVLDAGGLTDYAIVMGDPLLSLPAADLLVSHKSSILVEGVLLDIPTIGFDFRERNDFAFYPAKGIEWIAKREALPSSMLRCLLDAPTKARLAEERVGAKTYFNSANDGHAAERCVAAIEERVAKRRAA
jgi:CDP-glycerol glycerophosphotransferase (TagB/SpsB family)